MVPHLKNVGYEDWDPIVAT